MPSALQDSFLRTDADFLRYAMRSANKKATEAGSAVVSMVVTANHLTIAHAGDCKAVLIKRNGTYVDLTDDHTAEVQEDGWTPIRPDEAERVHRVGGTMVNGYVEVGDDRLPMTRAVGNMRLKTRGASHNWEDTRIDEQVVTALPDVCSRLRDSDDLAVVLASDGVFGTIMTSEQVAERARRTLLAHQGADDAETKTARMLAECAINEFQGGDNIGIVVVVFEPTHQRQVWLQHQESHDSYTPTEVYTLPCEPQLAEKLRMSFGDAYPPRAPRCIGQRGLHTYCSGNAFAPRPSPYLPGDLRDCY